LILSIFEVISAAKKKPYKSKYCWDESTEYVGKTSKVGKFTCQKWNRNSPQSIPAKYRSMYRHNYCRNPTGSTKGPWCYTTSSGTRWRRCTIPKCAAVCKSVAATRNDPKGLKYRGKMSVTERGEECQNWDTNNPHIVRYTPIDGKRHNHCRNPDGDPDGPWCYIKNVPRDSKPNWRTCTIPTCKGKKTGDPNNCKIGNGSSYRGTTKKTFSGRRCQSWGSTSPQEPSNDILKLLPKGTTHSYCRNYDGDEGGPWCYTMDKRVRWQYCSQIPTCPKGITPKVTPTTPEKPKPNPELKCGIHCQCGSASSCYTGKDTCSIVNGVQSTIGEWPWQVGLRTRRGSNFCGGSVINKRYILTAAHCIADDEGNLSMKPEQLGIAIGFHDAYGNQDSVKDEHKALGRQFIGVKTIIKHENYEPTEVEDDIALLELEKDIFFPKEHSSYYKTKTLVRPVCLPSPDYDKTVVNLIPEHCVVSGWGLTQGTEKPGMDARKLIHGNLPIIKNDLCEEMLGEGIDLTASDRQMCAKSKKKNPVDTCSGDSGGPLSCTKSFNKKRMQYIQVGVTSWGFGCAEKTPGVYTRVSKYIDWIKKHAGEVQIV